ncbi:hypothetical protein ACEZCY_12400 [Streptacidiphilus sp. N1-12]|uniref:Uncharacterized protein n=2 Tax=Streptacidiphilus alkalitolerans TaxID=3342712 RepID=A0ABV6V8K2_9ACTN
MRAQPRVRLRGQDVARGLVLAGGLALVGFGVAGFLGEPYLNGHRLQVLLWAAGAIVLHDGVWAPVLLLAGAVLVRVVPALVRGPVLVGLITAAGLTAVGFPAVLREDQHNGNPTLLPLPYLRNWLLLLGLVVVAVAVWVGVAAAVARRRARPKEQPLKRSAK